MAEQPPIAAESDRWPEFVVPWDDISTGPTDMSRYLEKPAGSKGFIQAVGGHLATGDGKRWRLWGVGMVFASWFPPMEIAGVVARRLAKYGINCLRFHHLDHRWPNGILKRYDKGTSGPGVVPPGRYAHPGKASTRELDPEAMARLDWFVYCCKQNGVYVDLNLNVTRRFSVGDGVKDAEQVGFSKGLTYFDDRIVALEKEYAHNLLTHVNPFTGNRYADEPAVALIEILNENSLVEMWVRGHLVGELGPNENMTRRHIPSSYARDLDRLYNRFLAGRYESREALLAAWEGDLRPYEDALEGTVRRLGPGEFARAAKQRFHDEASFYHQIERTFFADMASYLRGELGVKQLIVPTSDWDHSFSALPSLEAEATQDVMDGHAYWQAHWQRTSIVSHLAQVDAPDASLPAVLSRTIVKGRPYIVSEINESFPNDSACELIPLLAAYALLQDWDGFFWHSYTGGHFTWDRIWQDQSILHHLRICNDPLKMSQMAIGGLMFHRGDVAAARQVIDRAVPWEWALESLRQPRPANGSPYWLDYLPGRASLVHRVQIADFHAQQVQPAPGDVELPTGKIVSDTGELTWEEAPNDGRVIINAPRHQGVIMRHGTRATTNLVVALETRFAAVQLTSLDDDRPIAQAGKLLLVAAGRVANTGLRWADSTRTEIADWGHAPTRIEPVEATLTLRGLESARRVLVQPLDGCGQPLGEATALQGGEAGFRLALPLEPASVWYLVTVER